MNRSEDLAAETLAAQVNVSVQRMRELLAAQSKLKTVSTAADSGFVQLLPRYAPEGVKVRYLTTSTSVPPGVLRGFASLPDVTMDVVQVPLTLDELAAAGMRASGELTVPADSDLSAEDGTVVFVTADEVGDSVREHVEAAAQPAKVRWEVGEVSKPLLGGGGAMQTCTGGFTVKVVGGTDEGLSTAGHCANYQTYVGYTMTTKAQAYSGNADLEWVDNASVNWDPSVWLGGPSNWPVEHRKNWDNAGINDPVCWYGKSTGGGCGILLTKTHKPANPSDATYSYGTSSYGNGDGGDSGGPVFYGTTAWGIVGGGTSAYTYFTPHARLESRLNVRVMIQ